VFELYFWTGGLYWNLVELGSDGAEGLVSSSELAVEDEVDDSMTTGNAVVRGLKE